jgi:hypothetical protein
MTPAESLWGAEAVEKALADPRPEAVSDDLLREFDRWAENDRLSARWALRLPWSTFCAVVRLVDGATRCDELEDPEE